ncbi:non-ribosomal peptide synthetase [Streptomyces sp. RerS4]|uniref:non-ribosomal peptide synthetase n=1 Tax=Streptomyces sp. RerS4 TaxID=2942449 RepID=UPI00201C9348|nr:non-ribosomal peptide synthetase [Streptomyces sp. RerS4]UQW99652.1 amino acid adenylation domain-containing protein [Streptomyces sp. RerS4]
MSPAAVPPRPDRGRAPLSYAQRSIWRAEQVLPGSALHNETAAFRLDGPVDARALERALAVLAARHEVMRCAVVADADGEPLQHFADRVLPTVERTDLAHLPEQQREERLAELVARAVAAPFDLARPPLMRTCLYRLGEDRHLLLFVAHHIVVDAWAFGVFLQELAAAYVAETGGPAPEAAAPGRDFGDYATWQRSDPAAAHGLDHWRERLAGELPVLRLPADGPGAGRPADALAGAVHRFVIPADLVAGLGSLARTRLATLPAAVLTAFCAVAQRYTGQDDLVVGMPVATRNRPALGAMIGPLLNVVAHRVDLSGDPAFDEALRRTRQHLKSDLAHRDTPFDLVVEDLAPAGGGPSPLFQLMYAFHSGPTTLLHLPGVETTPAPAHSGTAKYDLSLFLRPRPSGDLDAELEYRTALLSPQTVQGIAEGLLCLLEAAVAEPGRRLSELPVMSDEQTRRVLTGFNASDRTRPDWSTVPEALRVMAARSGDVPAVLHGDEAVTRAELDAAADRVAARLADRWAVRPGDRVALLVPRAAGLLALVVGLWRAGAVLVPLDETMPDERVRYVLEDSGARLLVTGPAASPAPDHAVPCAAAAELLAVSSGDDVPAPDGPAADALAYLMYTSGSTGRPKGVAVPHDRVANLLHSIVREPGLGEDDVLVAVTSLTFDISVLELFAPLVAGSRVVIAPHATVRDPEALGALLDRSGATVMQATPSLWRALVDGGWQGRPTLRALSGGEALDPALAERLLDRCGELWNLYGPTETTIWSTAGRVLPGEPVTVGRPVARTYCHILDRHGRPVPVGAAGELVIGGAGVTAGYWNRADLTAAAFVPDPVGADPLGGANAPVYRTGDLARYLPDGRIVVLGRADQQVKILGHRIELGEIEALLTRHRQVRAAAVVIDGQRPGTPRPVAFVVPEGTAADADALGADLRRHLRTLLPAAVVPSVIALLDELPLNTSGKVDRPALSTAARTLPDTAAAADRVAPATDAERTVIALWADLLGVDPGTPGVTDDFFLSGGNSIVATRLLGRVRDALGHAPSLADFYADPTPRALSARPSTGPRPGAADTAPPAPVPVPQDPVPLTDQQRQLWLTQSLVPDSAAYNLAAAARLDGPVDADALARALRELVTRHPVLATRCHLADEGPVLVRLPADRVRPTVLDVPEETEAQGGDATRSWLDSATADEATRPFDLAEGPLLRVTLLRASDTSVLLFTAHHIAVDGWSITVAVRELAALHALHTGTGSPLPPLAREFLGHAAAAAAPAAVTIRDAQLAYWRTRLDGHCGVLDLPVDPDAGPCPPGTGDTVPVVLPPDLTARLRATAARLRVTPFSVLLTVYASLLGRYAGTDDVIVGVPAANRGAPELEGLIGSLVNSLPVRVDLAGSPSFGELARRTARRLADDLDRPLVPLDRLVDALGIARDPGRPALAQATLVLQEALPARIRLGEASGDLRPVPTRTAKYDLTLALEDHPDRMEGVLEYASGRFTRTSAGRFARHLETLLRAALDDPEAAAALAPLDPAEEETPSPRPARPAGAARAAYATPVHELFRAQAAAGPGAVAVRHGGQSVTYAALDAWSDRIAARLLRLGAAPGRFVSVLLPTGIAQTAAVLAVAKTGAAFAVLDPDSPELRLRAVITDAEPLCVLADERCLTRLPGLWDPVAGRFAGVPVEPLPSDEPDAGAHPPVPSAPVTGDDALCLVYTSGSTGTPKGIALPHASLAQFADWQGERFGIGPRSRIAQWAPFTYDAAYTEVFAALCHGATLCVPPDETRRDPVAMAAWLGAERITQIQTVPGFFAVLTEALDRGRAELPHLEHVLLAGEVLPPSLAAAWAGRTVRPRLHNLYGPTECVLATHRELEPGEEFAPSVPIGRPLAGREALVLDHRGRPCPVGVVGEIHLRSDFLAGAYHRRPEESAKAYVPDPWRPGGTLYRTGDLGRFLPDGELAFTGRTGSLVKIHGNRVELEEIEALLQGHPSVREAAAALHGTPTAPRLLAYAVVDGAVTGDDLRAHLAERLPASVVPESVVLLDALPRTRTNKRDRARLPAPRTDAPHSAAPPREGPEQLVAEAWRQVLGADRPVGRHTNFFEAGGNSLLAARLQVDLGRRLGREVRLVDVFARPTIAEFVAGLRTDTAADAPHAPGHHGPAGPDDVAARAGRRRAAVRARSRDRAEQFNVPTGRE